MEKSVEPNIFNFGTSELSQDAFISWLVSWIRFPDSELHLCAKEFIALFYNKYQETIMNSSKQIDAEQISALLPVPGYDSELFTPDEEYIRRQYMRIDVYFRVKINDRIVSFVIEDKVHTSYHSDQLKRYKDTVLRDKIEEDEIVFIYFKTGYPYQIDLKVDEEGYCLIDYEVWNRFLEEQGAVSNTIFNAYRKYFHDCFYTPFKSNLNNLHTVNGFESFKHYFTQYKFLLDLSNQCPDNININSVYSGTSYGRPWAQYHFIQIDDIYGVGVHEYVFYRLDSKIRYPKSKSMYYLGLRQWANIKTKDSEAVEKKRLRLDKYRSIYNQCSIENIEFEREPSRRGVKESEIACLHFDSNVNTTQQVIDNLGFFHKQFVDKVRGKM